MSETETTETATHNQKETVMDTIETPALWCSEHHDVQYPGRHSCRSFFRLQAVSYLPAPTSRCRFTHRMELVPLPDDGGGSGSSAR